MSYDKHWFPLYFSIALYFAKTEWARMRWCLKGLSGRIRSNAPAVRLGKTCETEGFYMLGVTCQQFIVLVIKPCDLALYVHVPLNFTCEEFMNLMVIALFIHLDTACKYMYWLQFYFFSWTYTTGWREKSWLAQAETCWALVVNDTEMRGASGLVNKLCVNSYSR